MNPETKKLYKILIEVLQQRAPSDRQNTDYQIGAHDQHWDIIRGLHIKLRSEPEFKRLNIYSDANPPKRK